MVKMCVKKRMAVNDADKVKVFYYDIYIYI